MTDDSPEVVLTLTNSEALVLFDFVSRFSNTDVLEIQDRAEAQVLWNVCCLLEKQSLAPFNSDFNDVLRAAREKLRPIDSDG